MPLTLTYRETLLASKYFACRLRPTLAICIPIRQPTHPVETSRFQSNVRSQMSGRADYSQGKIYARPGQNSVDQLPPATGLQPLGTRARRDGLIYTPRSYDHGQPAPLCIIMHGAGGNAKGALFPPLEDISEKVCHPHPH